MRKINKILFVSLFFCFLVSVIAEAQNNSIRKITISSGASLSEIIDLYDYKYLNIVMPTAWTTATLTFQVAPTKDGQLYSNLYDDDGIEVSVTADANRAISIDNNALNLAASRFIKLRSGTAATPVAQEGERTIYFILKK